MLAQTLTTLLNRISRCGVSGMSSIKVDFFHANHYVNDMHDSRTVANEILRVAGAHGNTLTPMQLLKLTYIAHGWHLGLYGEPLISDRVEAWQYGPVIRTLYDAIKQYQDRPVCDQIPAPAGDTLSPSEKKVIRQVVEIYGSKSGPALSRLTHAKGTPWWMVYEEGTFGIPIPNDIIEDHYKQLAEART